jgi:hypothetical protein
MASNDLIRLLIGTWEQVFLIVYIFCFSAYQQDAFFLEMGIGRAMRLLANKIHPRLTINEKDGQWTVKSEMMLTSKAITFKPDVEFDDTLPDGLEVKV